MITRILAITTALLAFLIPEMAFAGVLPIPVCSAIPGCGSAVKNILLDGTYALAPQITRFLLNLTSGLSVVFVIIGGARYLISFGRDEEYSKAKNTIQWALLGLIVALASHRIVFMVISENYVADPNYPFISFMATIVRVITMLLNVAFLMIVISSGIRIIMARGKDEEVGKGKEAILYAITGAIIINVAPFVVRQVLLL